MTLLSSQTNAMTIVAGLVLSCSFIAADSLPAQEVTLRWKFEEGDTYRAESRQFSTIDTRVEKRTSRITSEVTLVSDWKVIQADDSSAKIEQTIKEVRLSVDNPADATKSVSVDTSSDKRPPKQSRQLAKQMSSLIGISLTFAMNDLGEISEIEAPESTKSQLNSLPDESVVRQLLEPASLQASAMILPKSEVSVDSSWKLDGPSDDLRQAKTATYLGRRNVDNRELDLVELKLSNPTDEKSNESETLAQVDWSGKYWFDSIAGFCARSEQRSDCVATKSYREMEVESRVAIESRFQLSR